MAGEVPCTVSDSLEQRFLALGLGNGSLSTSSSSSGGSESARFLPSSSLHTLNSLSSSYSSNSSLPDFHSKKLASHLENSHSSVHPVVLDTTPPPPGSLNRYGASTNSSPLILPSIPKSSFPLNSHSTSNSSLGNGDAQSRVEKVRPAPAFEFPNTISLSVKQLSQLLSKSGEQILLLDVRPFDDFKRHHINAPNVVNIDPLLIRSGQTGEDLEDRLVISSDEEASAFARRNSFELVIYYDKNTTSLHFNEKFPSPTLSTLKNLVSTIYEHEMQKPLRRQPCLLQGGLDAWDEFMVRSPSPPRLPLSSFTPTNIVAAITSSTVPSLPAAASLHSLRQSSTLSQRMPVQSTRSSLESATSNTKPISNSDSDEGNSVVIVRDLGSYLRRPQQPTDMVLQRPAPTVDRAFISSKSSNLGGITSESYDLGRSSKGFTPVTAQSIGAQIQVSPASTKSRTTLDTSPSANLSMQTASLRDRQPSIGNSYSTLGETSAGVTGLKNLGNSCYMNSVIQCLAGTTMLARYFLSGAYKQHINLDNKLGAKGILARAFGDLITSLYSDQAGFIAPIHMKKIVGSLRSEFAGSDQQDAQEFLTFLVDGLHEDLNMNGGKERLRPLTEEEERKREKLSVRYGSYVEWNRYLKSDRSAIVNMFQGQYQSQLRCLTCNFTSTTYNPFTVLSLPLPQGKRVTLEQCVDLFVMQEVLDKEDAWRCPHCKVERTATKTLRIARLPVILIIHLKRFETNGRWSNKLDTFVDYPIHGLDLTKYWPDYRQEDRVWIDKVEPDDQIPPFRYNLYGVVNHYGTLRGGHYTAYVNKSSKGWLVFDDSRVGKCSSSSLVSRDGYVLFYERDMRRQ
ncbi:uncharacterized protein V1516DRAFT_669336 [Lipomyces oligophaga]|uniref:uncharacterized protein n=1 Tax=Lipomyces oligophaga TaxID=45792 RepID=UPI0034CDD41B